MIRNACCYFQSLRGRWGTVLASTAVLLFLAVPTFAQPTFSIDGQSPSSLGGLGFVSEGDLLAPGPVPIGAGAGLGIAPTGTGPFPAVTFAEMDAMSYGVDSLSPFSPLGLWDVHPGTGHDMVHRWYFSVDEFAGGAFYGLASPGPSVLSEGSTGALEASADVFLTQTAAPYTPAGFPAPPFSFFPGNNIQVLDGDGSSAPPLGLIEPNPPTPFGPPIFVPDIGDNLDALDFDTPTPAPAPLPAGTPVFFSLDSLFPDPIENPLGIFPGPNYGTAVANGFSGSDILLSATGAGAFVPFAPAGALGLDMAGFDTDDIDALIVADTGPTPGAYDPSAVPYDWLGGGTDMVLFSLRRGSALIGTPDGLTGTPIEEGDILVPLGAGVVPGIFVAAEDIGLGTLRSGSATFVDPFTGTLWADDLDALDVKQHLRGDVNGDFKLDTLDIDALEASTPGVIPLSAATTADVNFDYKVDPTFYGLSGTLVSDVDQLVREIFGTEYGDLNLDGFIDASDFGLFAAGFGTGTTWAEGDLNADDMVDAADAGIMFANWTGDTPPPSLASLIPEPTAMSLFIFGMCGLMTMRGKRL